MLFGKQQYHGYLVHADFWRGRLLLQEAGLPDRTHGPRPGAGGHGRVSVAAELDYVPGVPPDLRHAPHFRRAGHPVARVVRVAWHPGPSASMAPGRCRTT